MMPEIKLFMFQSGTQHCRYQHIRMNQGVGEHYEIPVPWFLLTHPDGFTLIDGGLAVEGLKDPSGYWGSAVEQFKPVMSEEQGCASLLLLNHSSLIAKKRLLSRAVSLSCSKWPW